MQIFKSFLSKFDDNDNNKNKINDEQDKDEVNNINNSFDKDKIDKTDKINNNSNSSSTTNKKKKKKTKKLADVPSNVSTISNISNPTFDVNFDDEPFDNNIANKNVNDNTDKKDIIIEKKVDIVFEPASNFDDFEFSVDDKIDNKIKPDIAINNNDDDPFGDNSSFEIPPPKLSSELPNSTETSKIESDDPFASDFKLDIVETIKDDNNMASYNTKSDIIVNRNDADPFGDTSSFEIPTSKFPSGLPSTVDTSNGENDDPFAESSSKCDIAENIPNTSIENDPFSESTSVELPTSIKVIKQEVELKSKLLYQEFALNKEARINDDPFGDSNSFELPDVQVKNTVGNENPFAESTGFELPRNNQIENSIDDPFVESPSFFLSNNIIIKDEHSNVHSKIKDEEDPFGNFNTLELPSVSKESTFIKIEKTAVEEMKNDKDAFDSPSNFELASSSIQNNANILEDPFGNSPAFELPPVSISPNDTYVKSSIISNDAFLKDTDKNIEVLVTNIDESILLDKNSSFNSDPFDTNSFEMPIVNSNKVNLPEVPEDHFGNSDFKFVQDQKSNESSTSTKAEDLFHDNKNPFLSPSHMPSSKLVLEIDHQDSDIAAANLYDISFQSPKSADNLEKILKSPPTRNASIFMEHERTNSVFFGDRQALLNQIIELEAEKDSFVLKLNKSQTTIDELNEKLNSQSMRHIQDLDTLHQVQREKEHISENKLAESEDKHISAISERDAANDRILLLEKQVQAQQSKSERLQNSLKEVTAKNAEIVSQNEAALAKQEGSWNEKLNNLNLTLESIRTQLDAKTLEIDNLHDQLDSSTQEIVEIKNELNKSNSLLNSARIENENLKEGIKSIKEESNSKSEQLNAKLFELTENHRNQYESQVAIIDQLTMELDENNGKIKILETKLAESNSNANESEGPDFQYKYDAMVETLTNEKNEEITKLKAQFQQYIEKQKSTVIAQIKNKEQAHNASLIELKSKLDDVNAENDKLNHNLASVQKTLISKEEEFNGYKNDNAKELKKSKKELAKVDVLKSKIEISEQRIADYIKNEEERKEKDLLDIRKKKMLTAYLECVDDPPYSGQEVSARHTFPEDLSLGIKYQWYNSFAGNNFTPIKGANTETLLCSVDHIGSVIRIEVTNEFGDRAHADSVGPLQVSPELISAVELNIKKPEVVFPVHTWPQQPKAPERQILLNKEKIKIQENHKTKCKEPYTEHVKCVLDPVNHNAFTLMVNDKLCFSYYVPTPAERDIVVATIRAFTYSANEEKDGSLKYLLRLSNESRAASGPLPIEAMYDKKTEKVHDDLNIDIKDHTHHSPNILSSPIPVSTPSANQVSDKFSNEPTEHNSQSIEVVEEKYGDHNSSEAGDVVEELKPVIKVLIKATSDGPVSNETLRRNTLNAPPPSVSGKSKRLTVGSSDAPKSTTDKEKRGHQKFASMIIEEKAEVFIPPLVAPISFAAINGQIPVNKTSKSDLIHAPTSNKLTAIVEESENLKIDSISNKIENIDMFATELIHAKLEGGKVIDFSLIGEISISIKESSLKDQNLLFYCRLDNMVNVQNLIVNPKFMVNIKDSLYSIKVPNQVVSNVTVAKYKIDLKVCSRPPLLILPQWKITEHEAQFIAKYKVNVKVIRPDVDVQFLAAILPDNSVKSCLNHEPISTMIYNEQKQKCLWKLPLPQLDGHISANFATNSEIKPSPLLVNFQFEGNLSGLSIINDRSLEDSNCYINDIVHRIKAGNFSAN